jgi:hypothetical protein
MNLEPYTTHAEVLRPAVLTPEQMCSMNFARLEFDRLCALLGPLCDQFMLGHDEGPLCDVARHLEQIRIFSGNFCWKHRHLGASVGEVDKGDRA